MTEFFSRREFHLAAVLVVLFFFEMSVAVPSVHIHSPLNGSVLRDDAVSLKISVNEFPVDGKIVWILNGVVQQSRLTRESIESDNPTIFCHNLTDSHEEINSVDFKIYDAANKLVAESWSGFEVVSCCFSFLSFPKKIEQITLRDTAMATRLSFEAQDLFMNGKTGEALQTLKEATELDWKVMICTSKKSQIFWFLFFFLAEL